LLSYPLHLAAGTADPLTWGAGGTYLLVVLVLSVFGASLFAGSLRTDLRLSAALSEREARLQSYFDLSLVGTAILSPDGTCSEVNDELCRMLGYSRAELRRLSWPALVPPEERDAAGALLARALSDGGAPECRDMRCARKEGETIHAIVSLRGLPGAEGVIDHVMLVVQDITERKRAEAERERYLARAEEARREAEEASRAKDAFLATVSHELRTPLTPILAWSGILREGGLGGAQTITALSAIERSARAQAQLIDDLLDVSRIVSGEWRLAPRPVDLGPIVQAAVDVMRPAAEAKGVDITTTSPARAVSVQGDPARLQQVIWNLVANAVKFTPRGGRVEVGFERADPHARITVRDTGEGISPGFLPHVFDRFRQADSSSTRRYGGLGLGLAIVRALVELHGGTVHAESAGEGLGATFTVELPLASSETRTAGAELAHAVPRASLEGLRVLVVDDDPESNAVVSTVLASCGADVRTALSTREALELAGRWQPDVLVSDIAMPGEDGLALLETLRARGGSFGRLPAVALTACAGPGDRRRLLAAGFQAYVAKPFRPAELAAVVESAATPAA
jgi:PAS domain S-box-containing protein